MPKIKYRELIKNTDEKNMNARRFYENKYFSLFLNAYEFPELTEEQTHYLLKRLWKDGTISAFVLEGSKPNATLKDLLGNRSKNSLSVGVENPNGLLIFSPYSVSQWNAQDFPSVISFVTTRGAGFIPNDLQIVNKTCVVGFAHTSHAPIRDLVMFYIDKICDVENTIETNLFVHKLPRLIVVSPEDHNRVEEIINAIERGEHKLFLDAEDYQAIKNVLDAGGSYIIDKLYQYKESLENELLTFLGIDNIGLEKRERLIVDEANANNDIINDESDCFLDSLKSFCKRITNILNFPLSVRAKSSPVVAESQTQKEDQTNDDDQKGGSNND